MAVNYYDQFQPLTYNPMSLQEMLIGPQMMQQKHDEAQALLDQESLFDVPALTVDQPGVQEWMDKYKSNINELADNLLRSGYNKDLARKARRILQEKQQATSSRGYLGKASKAYQDYLKNVEDEKKRLERGEINRDQYQRGLALALQRYNQAGGASKDATWSPWTSTKAIDLQELVSKYGKEITPQTIAQDLGYKYDPTTGIITDSSNKTVTISPQRISQVIQSRIRSNPEAMAYLKEREQLGLSDGVMNELSRLGAEGALTFARNDSETKTSYDFGLFKKFREDALELETLRANARLMPINLNTKFADLNKEAEKTVEERIRNILPYKVVVNGVEVEPDKNDITDKYREQRILPRIYYEQKYGEGNVQLIAKTPDELKSEREYVINNNPIENLLEKGYQSLSSQQKSKLSYEEYKKGFSELAKKNGMQLEALQPDSSVTNAFKQDSEALENGQLPWALDQIRIGGEQILDEEKASKKLFDNAEVIKVSKGPSAILNDGSLRYLVTTSDKNGKNRKTTTVDISFGENRADLKQLKEMYNIFLDNTKLGTEEIEIANKPFKINRNVIGGNIYMTVQEGIPIGTRSGRTVIEYGQPETYKEWYTRILFENGLYGNYRAEKTKTPPLIK